MYRYQYRKDFTAHIGLGLEVAGLLGVPLLSRSELCALDSGPARDSEALASAGVCTWSPTPYQTGGALVREVCILPGRGWWKMPLTAVSQASSDLACVPVAI